VVEPGPWHPATPGCFSTVAHTVRPKEWQCPSHFYNAHCYM
jgi:hypothetical protein